MILILEKLIKYTKKGMTRKRNEYTYLLIAILLHSFVCSYLILKAFAQYIIVQNLNSTIFLRKALCKFTKKSPHLCR